jgi:RNA polymerase-binding transcription factor DksA
MATKKSAPKKKAAPAKKAPVKKVAPKKAAPAKKAPAKKVAPKKAAPVKKAVPPKKAAPVKKAAPKPAPVKKALPAKKEVPAKKVVPVAKPAPAKKAPQPPAKPTAKPAAKATAPAKQVPAKGAKPAAAPVTKSGKKVPVISPETRFAETSKTVASPAEIRKALRAKESKKDVKPIAIPKISTKSSRKYEPEFTRSVLDSKGVEAPPAHTQRYSDVDLAEFRELVQNKLSAAKQELTYLNGLITRKDSMSGEDSDSRYMTMEDGSLSMEREQLSQMASRQIDFIEKLEKALMRIENKTYGICRVTGRLIDKARLRAVPHATLSMEAKMGMNRPGAGN